MTGTSLGRFLTDNKDVVQVAKSVHNILVYTGLAYLVFVIYGSLVPLDFHYRSWDDAWQAFKSTPYLDLGISSRADWVANILLFIPLAFIWQGILWPRNSLGLKLLSSFVVLMFALMLDVGIEFTQLYFPPRTVSLNDIYAETLGGCLGVALWWGVGERLVAWLERWMSARDDSGLAQRLLYLYFFGLFAYNLLPLDLTLSPVEIFHKWREGRVILIPFGYAFDNPQQALYSLISDVVTWMPVAFLWRLSGKRSALSIWLYAVAAAVLLEFLQLFVYTRISNVTQIITAGLGAALGLLLANFFYKSERTVSNSSQGSSVLRVMAWAAATLFWSGVIVTVFWYPFDFHYSRESVVRHLPDMLKVPFVDYYYGTEYRAITEVMHKMMFFFPLGVLLAFGVSQIRHFLWRSIASWCAVLTVAVFAFGIELGQLLLPGKYADITDCVLEFMGGWSGYVVAAVMIARFKKTSRTEHKLTKIRDSNSAMPTHQDDLAIRQNKANQGDSHA